MLRRGSQGHGDVIGNLVTGNGDHTGVANRAIGEDSDIRGAATNVDEADTQVSLILGNHRVT